jgi:selenide,water dikinase
MGCIPEAAFRNQTYVEDDTRIADTVPYELKMLALDPQTSGGMLASLAELLCDSFLEDLRACRCEQAARIGTLKARTRHFLELL